MSLDSIDIKMYTVYSSKCQKTAADMTQLRRQNRNQSNVFFLHLKPCVSQYSSTRFHRIAVCDFKVMPRLFTASYTVNRNLDTLTVPRPGITESEGFRQLEQKIDAP